MKLTDIFNYTLIKPVNTIIPLSAVEAFRGYLEVKQSYFLLLATQEESNTYQDKKNSNDNYNNINKLKKLLYVLANAVPYVPNITKLSEQIETTSRSSTLQYLHYL